MNYYLPRLKICALFFLFFPSFVSGRASEPAADTVPKHALFAGAGYGSNMVYLGSTISGNQPFLYSSLVYSYKSEFYASFSAVHLFDYGHFPGSISASLNYNHIFNSWFDISAGMSAFKFNSAAEDNFIDHFYYGDVTLGVDWRLIYSQLSFGILNSDESSLFFQAKNSRYFSTPELWTGRFNISFDPYINFLFGKYYSIDSPEGTYAVAPLPGKGKGRPVPPATIYKDKFGIIEIDFGVPVSFNFDRLTIEAEPGYVIQTHGTSQYSGPKGFVFLLSGYFSIF